MKHVISKAGLVPTETLIKRLAKVGLAAGGRPCRRLRAFGDSQLWNEVTRLVSNRREHYASPMQPNNNRLPLTLAYSCSAEKPFAVR
jgi:hypothetical protein